MVSRGKLCQVLYKNHPCYNLQRKPGCIMKCTNSWICIFCIQFVYSAWTFIDTNSWFCIFCIQFVLCLNINILIVVFNVTFPNRLIMIRIQISFLELCQVLYKNHPRYTKKVQLHYEPCTNSWICIFCIYFVYSAWILVYFYCGFQCIISIQIHDFVSFVSNLCTLLEY